MVYARRKRFTYRRKGRRGNRTLSTRNIFNNKSARAQAGQLNSLKKRINRVARMCKPEVKVRETPIAHDVIGLNNIYPGATISNFKLYEPYLPTTGTTDDNRIGNLINVYSLKINFSSQYKKIINSVSTPIASPLINTSGGVRMIVLQSKSALDNPPDLTNVLEGTPTSLADSVGILNMPFKTGITARYHILYNRIIYYSENQLIKCKNLRIRPALRKMRWEDGYKYPAGQFWVFLIAGGFSFVDVGLGDTPYDYDVCDYSIKFEVPFTDA